MNDWVCVTRLGGYGDNMIAASVLPGLKKRHKYVEFIAQSPRHVVLENNPHIDKLTVLEEGHIPGATGVEWQDWFVRRRREYAELYHLSHSIESMLVFNQSQTQFYHPAEWRRAWCNRSYIETAHDICGVPHNFAPLYFPTQAETERAEATAARINHRPLIGFCLGGSRLDKVYPNSPTLVARLIRDLGAAVIMFGGDGERDWQGSKQIMEEVQSSNGSLAGLHQAISPTVQGGAGEVAWRADGGLHVAIDDKKPEPLWPIRRSFAQLRTCDVVLGPDTGPMWSVAFEPNIAKVLLLSHATPRNISSHWPNTVSLHADIERVPCWSCHRLHETIATCVPDKSNKGAACISDISVTAILDAVASRLDRSVQMAAD